jgi:hypothetical protein
LIASWAENGEEGLAGSDGLPGRQGKKSFKVLTILIYF